MPSRCDVSGVVAGAAQTGFWLTEHVCCSTDGTNHSSHDITQCFMSEAFRTPLSAELRASLEIPILILQGGALTYVVGFRSGIGVLTNGCLLFQVPI